MPEVKNPGAEKQVFDADTRFGRILQMGWLSFVPMLSSGAVALIFLLSEQSNDWSLSSQVAVAGSGFIFGSLWVSSEYRNRKRSNPARPVLTANYLRQRLNMSINGHSTFTGRALIGVEEANGAKRIVVSTDERNNRYLMEIGESIDADVASLRECCEWGKGKFLPVFLETYLGTFEVKTDVDGEELRWQILEKLDLLSSRLTGDSADSRSIEAHEPSAAELSLIHISEPTRPY